ncbi:MAG TPA: hypothetical protein VFT62_02890 [Mycobacteriales bacterium]|nr:hypothetical protein [Mycobacteriales bacterium]
MAAVSLTGIAAAATSTGSPTPPGNHSVGSGTVQGSNGTVKVDGEPFDSGLGNEPHVACHLRVEFYGFDVGTDTATVTFTGQAPSGKGVAVTPTSGASTFSFTGSGPGNALDGGETYSLDTSGLKLQPQQGYHIRITTTVTNQQGATTYSKQKVIWVAPCAPPPPPPGPGPVAPSLTGVCDTTTGMVAWTVDNPNSATLSGTWTVTPTGETGSIDAAPGVTGFGPTTGDTATVTFPADRLTSGPVTVPCPAPQPPPPTLVAPSLSGVCDTTSGQVTWTVTNPNTRGLQGTWVLVPSQDTGTIGVPKQSTRTFNSGGGTITITFGRTGLTSGPVTVPCAPAPPAQLVAPTLAGACDTSTGQVTWTVTNPNTVDLVGDWAVTPGPASGHLTVPGLPATNTASFTSGGGTATVTFPAAHLTAGPVSVPCTAAPPPPPPPPPVVTPLTAPTLAGACDSTTALVTWTLANPNGTPLTGTWAASDGSTGSVTAPANATGTFTTPGGAVTVSFPASTALSAVAETVTCVLPVKIQRPDLAIVKVASADKTKPGDVLSYDLRVRNVGAGSTTGAVTVTDSVPSSLRPTGVAGDGWDCSFAGQDLTCTWTGGAVRAGQRLPVITVTTDVRQGATGTLVNTGVVRTPGDHNLVNNRSTVQTPVIAVLPERVVRTPQQLPFTGAGSAGLVPYGSGMVLGGLLLLLTGRRRRRA